MIVRGSTVGPERPTVDDSLALLPSAAGGPLGRPELEASLPLLEEIPVPVLWIGTGHALRWANRAALALTGGTLRPLCYQQLHGYDSPCEMHSMQCPKDVAQGCGRAVSTTHVEIGPAGANLSRVMALPVADGSTVELMVPLPRPLAEDRLTGLLPRHLGASLVERAFDLMRRLGRPLSILMLDLDFFKRVNDRYGHETGDRVLTAVGRTLSGCNRRTDLAIRWGGEEFLIVLPDTDRIAAAEHAEKLLRRVRALGLSAANEPLPVTASIGLWSGAAGTDPAEAIRAADAALLEAKRTGRDRCVQSPPAA